MRPKLPSDAPGFSQHFPSGDPAREDPPLSLIQEVALPHLLWFFDSLRNRGSGRTHMAAILCIELAIRGHEVILEDVSLALCGATHQHGQHRRFMEMVFDIAKEHYPRYLLSTHNKAPDGYVLIFKGMRPGTPR